MSPKAAPVKKFAALLKALPAKPGVYIFKNANGRIIYVGKAALLRNRVRSYFGSTHAFEAKTRRLVAQIADIEFILTGSEQEALLLEATLVKRHQPFYNVRLKDDKHYPYLKIDVTEDWPRVQITRRISSDGSRYFGPFASAGSVRRTLDLVKKLFPWRSCTKEITGDDPRPCLEYFIHRCIGPCASLCSKEEYDTVIRQTIMFLEGRTDEITRDLRRQMQKASADLEYERAARLRDQVQAIDRTTERQVMEVRDRTDMDVFGLAREEQEAYVQVFFVRKGLLIGRDIFQLDGTVDETDAEILRSFVEQFYESAPYVPARVLLPVKIDDADLIAQWLTQRRGERPNGRRAGAVRVMVPTRGEKRMLVQRAVDNARESLQQARAKWMADRGKTDEALQQLQDELELPSLPKRIECYDISNIQGTSAVGSMVVFEDGTPKKSEYRRFRIKGVDGQNDFAMMQEVLRRRFWRARRQSQEEGANEGGEYDESFGAMPDFVIVDGGKGQVSAAHDAMRNLGIGHIPLAGLAKRFEELFVVGVSEPVVLDRKSQALYLVQRIRDEAHRFAITYHRNVRKKSGLRSALDDVPGVGPKRKRALLRKFGSLKGVRDASADEIAQTPGFTRGLAEKVLEAL
ncbi:MAG: excinuclease ABC subunit UvrC [Chloroflexi bacterium]|nr:excinuclease ABC subunit UvrC [Chloroflexota bacterium]MCI0882823.1 excinuclease ABC subunit UvrC [Chloroflexota bacterium]